MFRHITALCFQRAVGHKQDRDLLLSHIFMSSLDLPKQLTLVVIGQKREFYLPHIQNIKAMFDIVL